MCRLIERRGSEFYKEPFNIQNVVDAITLLKKGGNACSGESTAVEYAQAYISGRRPAPRIEPWML